MGKKLHFYCPTPSWFGFDSKCCIRTTFLSARLETHPEFALIIESIKQLDNVVVVARGQDVNLHHVVFQLFLRLCVNDFGCSQGASLLVLSL